MSHTVRLEMELDGKTIILIPTADLRELEFEQIERDADRVLNQLESGEVTNVVFDFTNTGYYGSTALGFFVKLWKRVKAAEGQMVFCNVSKHEMEVLHLTHLDSVWPICTTREEALEVVKRGRAASN